MSEGRVVVNGDSRENGKPIWKGEDITDNVADVARTGVYHGTWAALGEQVVAEFARASVRGRCPDARAVDRVRQLSASFPDEAPFTIRRICEALMRPDLYKDVAAFQRTVERLFYVTSTVPSAPFGRGAHGASTASMSSATMAS
eukprot:CAMPEP_0117081004 /NCGR_PEP_ID=MMETSP0472-20121206/57126_1 /TAXON_ID=693140 ORGANISM="Tiarina fusus, Strain LIS" /NCGR_SAMPLE_ID=MMETSP0472 /ASSEMBLY_ACC=CAM_ASM_000603 /LENGTH=143 /DNA_ID=CAMNT_0004808823 /DNA_START=41 /DNA_END=468 /DNA_ORIENTATION=+